MPLGPRPVPVRVTPRHARSITRLCPSSRICYPCSCICALAHPTSAPACPAHASRPCTHAPCPRACAPCPLKPLTLPVHLRALSTRPHARPACLHPYHYPRDKDSAVPQRHHFSLPLLIVCVAYERPTSSQPTGLAPCRLGTYPLLFGLKYFISHGISRTCFHRHWDLA